MTNLNLLDVMSEIDPTLIDRAEAPVPIRKKPVFRTVLIAAVIAAMLVLLLVSATVAASVAGVNCARYVEQNYPGRLDTMKRAFIICDILNHFLQKTNARGNQSCAPQLPAIPSVLPRSGPLRHQTQTAPRDPAQRLSSVPYTPRGSASAQRLSAPRAKCGHSYTFLLLLLFDSPTCYVPKLS